MLRRNGKPKSCEPCRISKIKCDHAAPTCAKCQARGMVDQCFYHPNPMTKPAGTPRKRPEPRRRKGDAQSSRELGRLTSLTLSPPTLRNELDSVPVGNSWPTPPGSSSMSGQASVGPSRSFYLGSTSYASVFEEHRPLPQTLHEQPSERMSVTPSSVSSRNVGTRHCQMGVAHSIISRLSPFSFYEKSVKRYFKHRLSAPFVGPLIFSLLPQLRADLELLNAPDSNITQMYLDITKNTAKPLIVPSNMLPSEFHTLVTGSNLRWETLGLILSIAASNAQYSSPDDPVFTLEDGSKLDKDEYTDDMIQASNDCITLCNAHGAVNDVMVWLLIGNEHVISNLYGDNHHATWRRNGEVISALLATGMHCESESAKSEPIFLREIRRKVYAAAYRTDKTLAIFFGRPPLLFWRYSNRRMPLDLSDEVLCSDDLEAVNEAISRLDPAGWNTDGKIYPASTVRMRCEQAVCKERLLEQSLAGEKDSDVVANLQKISSELIQFWESTPAYMRHDSYVDPGSIGTYLRIRLTILYMDYLHMHFQVQRVLQRLTQQALPLLLEVSLKLLVTSLACIQPSNGIYELRRQIPTVIIFYCFPAAGVLALELRRCTLEGVPLPPTVLRSDIIRHLSVLTSCLEWIVLPGDGNHKLCSELNKMLAMVLDEVLNYQPPAQNVDGDVDALVGVGNGFFDMPLVDGFEPIPTEAEDFLNWMDNATWSNNVTLF